MTRIFDPEVIRAQIGNLESERDRIDRAIQSLESALRSIEGVQFFQSDLELTDQSTESITLHDMVKQVCNYLRDGITRQRVIAEIQKRHPFSSPKSSSVAASLINLTKGNQPMLDIAIPGRGRSPSFYSTEKDSSHRLTGEEIKELFDPSTTKGTGGWQSLFTSLQNNFNKATGEIRLTPEQRGRIYDYHRHGGGGWQSKVNRIFRRELPHLFAS